MISEIEQQAELLKSGIREFAEKEIAPHVSEWDETQRFPRELISKLAELGLMGCLLPPEFEGSGLSYPEYVLAIEELARIDGAVALFVAAHNSLCAGHVFLSASEDQKRRYLPGLAKGSKIGAWALTEPGSGSDACSARTSAVRKGAEYILNGSKAFVSNGSIADLYIVLAVTNRQAREHGLSAFLIERDTPGLSVGKKENKLGMRASDTAGLILEDCRVPAANLLGAEGEGFIDALRILDGGRISIAALAVGMAQGAYEHSLRYAKERQQFGRSIAEFQAIQFKLADMATEISAARLLTMYAAERKQRGFRTTKESSMAKLYASEVAVRVANEAVQIHGGYGFIKDFPVEKIYRDVKLCTIGEGTSEIQRIVIARQILG